MFWLVSARSGPHGELSGPRREPVEGRRGRLFRLRRPFRLRRRWWALGPAFGASYDLRLLLRALHVIGCSPSQDAVEGWEAGGGGGELVGVLVWHEVDVVEEELVEHPPDVLWCSVGRPCAGAGRSSLGDEHLFVGEVMLEGLDVLGGPVQVLGDAVLLPLQHIEGDGVFVVSLEELALLVLQLVAGGGELTELLFRVLDHDGQLVAQCLSVA